MVEGLGPDRRAGGACAGTDHGGKVHSGDTIDGRQLSQGPSGRKGPEVCNERGAESDNRLVSVLPGGRWCRGAAQTAGDRLRITGMCAVISDRCRSVIYGRVAGGGRSHRRPHAGAKEAEGAPSRAVFISDLVPAEILPGLRSDGRPRSRGPGALEAFASQVRAGNRRRTYRPGKDCVLWFISNSTRDGDRRTQPVGVPMRPSFLSPGSAPLDQ